MPAVLESAEVETQSLESHEEAPGRWLMFIYAPVALFSLKAPWATSTAGKTLLTPTFYAVKMAFLDAALLSKLVSDPEPFVRNLAKARLRIGLPQHACVTETVQRIRQETREADRLQTPELPPYRPNVAFREIVHYQGDLRFAFDCSTCSDSLLRKLIQVAPAINYIGRRGSFIQYLEQVEQSALDATFTAPAKENAGPAWGHRASLDDFGPNASFDALNSYTPTQIERGVHRIFVETHVPLGIRNMGAGFTHYALAPSGTL
ncbi:MAG TPA: hypothetical protein VH639_30000 [Bryobacteraceae bacterium]|jgi:hypothetical protein